MKLMVLTVLDQIASVDFQLGALHWTDLNDVQILVLYILDLELFNQNCPFSILSLKEYGVIMYTNLNTVLEETRVK